VDSAMQNIPQVVFESCQQLQVSRDEAIWFHPDWQDEIDSRFETLRERLYTENSAIEKRPELSQVEELTQQNQYEPIDCFNHALSIYTREYVPATYWAMLQHNLGLAYRNRIRGNRRENLGRAIGCLNESTKVYTKEKFPEKWKINQEDLTDLRQLLEELLKATKEDLAEPRQSLQELFQMTKEKTFQITMKIESIVTIPLVLIKLVANESFSVAKIIIANISTKRK
jgi:hypothetical protein